MPEIAANDAQREEWVKLFAIDEIKGDLTTPGYSKPLTPEFLKAHPTLVVDTRHFDADFTARLLEAIGDVDEQTDGVLFHSENFQALSAHAGAVSGAGEVHLHRSTVQHWRDGFRLQGQLSALLVAALMEDRLQLRHATADAGRVLCSAASTITKCRARLAS